MTGWRMMQPLTAEEVGRWTIGEPVELRILRAEMRKVDTVPASDTLLVVATELASNALRHARSRAVVALLRRPDAVIIDVADRDPRGRPAVDARRPKRSGGLGLRLTERLALDVGWYPAVGGKHVWARFALPASRPGGHSN
ncbi:ATP-binding protein [Paractinoplanes atraurantiacus]|uniref:Histidine kinase-like ATPase domain-containing protein n=1 Tax=Paractinoplanes atraurantiacus TaxID=1036182 RepID=A0A285KU84_9ACTN|nr:ATP-binding protein [Actinoplanes atraurantiacus]SNY74771.1 Histidine kinase-like ATPase domain-containing protein [Actinoplanes atraurantiacus]